MAVLLGSGTQAQEDHGHFSKGMLNQLNLSTPSANQPAHTHTHTDLLTQELFQSFS